MITKRNKILTIPIGIAGCGKTTNRDLSSIILSKDSIRFMLLNRKQTNRDYYLDVETNKENIIGKYNLENIVDYIFKKSFDRLIQTDYNIYLDGTNLYSRKREYYISKALNYGYKVNFILFKNFNQAIYNNLKRKRTVPREVMNRMFHDIQFLTKFESTIANSIKTIYDNDD